MSSTAKNTLTTLPASWYHESPMYELERRSIFSKFWILISHSSQFDEPGKYVRYEMAGFPFFVIKDRKGNINAFLNSCRHRAFPLVHEDSGKVNILACKYHGWSYGIGGNLAKAPRFDQVPEFDKNQYSLYKLHLHIDARGFIWINLDAAETPTISWEEQFGGVDTQQRLQNFDMKDYVYDHTWSMDGDFNWKTLVENYNECYHCPTAHPGLSKFITPTTKLVYDMNKYYIQHMADGTEEMNATSSPTYMFPNASITMLPTFFYMMSIVPKSGTKSLMRYEVYRNPKFTVEEFKADYEFLKQVEMEDKYLANGTQTNLNTKTYMAGPLHPTQETGVQYFDNLVRNILKSHVEKEKAEGRKIWPASRTVETKQLDEDMAFCNSVCSGTEGGEEGVLAW